MSTLINRIYLQDLSARLNRGDKRSIRLWCLKNHVEVFKDSSGEFVIESEFALIYNMPIINSLKSKYGNNWLVVFEAYEKNELHKLLDLNPNSIIEKKGYIPKGNLAKKIFGGS